MSHYLVTVFSQIINDSGFPQEKFEHMVLSESILAWYKTNNEKTQCGCEYYSIKSIEEIDDSMLYDIKVGSRIYETVELYKLLKLDIERINYSIIDKYPNPDETDYNSTVNRFALK